jgi:hypothetical protein
MVPCSVQKNLSYIFFLPPSRIFSIDQVEEEKSWKDWFAAMVARCLKGYMLETFRIGLREVLLGENFSKQH